MTTLINEPYVQTPSTLWIPARKGSIGDEVNDFADKIGVPRDPTQKRDIDILNSYGEDGRWLTLETCHIEGRQNGKTKAVYLPTILYRLFVYMQAFKEPDRIFWTSHIMKTTGDSFALIQKLIAENPILSKHVKKIRLENADEGIDLMDGSALDFISRSKGGGRGLSGIYGFFDEALFLEATFMGALLPTMSARDNPQIGYASSPGRKFSTQLRALQERGRAMNDPTLTYIEYKSDGEWDDPPCALGIRCSHLIDDPQGEGCCFDDEDRWRQCNHAIDQGRMRVQFVRAERRALCKTPLGVIEFGAERMGWSELAEGVLDPDRIPMSDWNGSKDESSRPIGDVVIAVDIPPSGDRAVITVAGFNEQGKIHFGVIEYERGTNWAAKRLAQLQDKHDLMCGILWQPDAPVKAIKSQLEIEGVSMWDVSAGTFSQYCGAFKNLVTNDECRMRPSGLLDTAFMSAERRVSVEGAWRWDRRKGGEDISPLCGVTMCVGAVEEFGQRDPQVLVF